jgi:transposase InsO family protein
MTTERVRRRLTPEFKREAVALVTRALMMAINLRNPQPGLLHHSDRGSQYARKAYRELLDHSGRFSRSSQWLLT